MPDTLELSDPEAETWADRMRVRMAGRADMELAREMELEPARPRGGTTEYAKTVAGYLGPFRRGEPRGLKWVFGDEVRLEALASALKCRPDDLRADLRFARGEHGLRAGALLLPGFEDLGAFSFEQGFVLPPCYAPDGERVEADGLLQRIQPGKRVRISGPGARTALLWLADFARREGWQVQRWAGAVPSGRARVVVDLDGDSVADAGPRRSGLRWALRPSSQQVKALQDGGHVLLAVGEGDLTLAPVDRGWLDAFVGRLKSRLSIGQKQALPELEELGAARLTPWEAGVLLRHRLDGGGGLPLDRDATLALLSGAARRRLVAEDASPHLLALMANDLVELGLSLLLQPDLELSAWAGAAAGATASALVDDLALTAKQRAILRAAIPSGSAEDVADAVLRSGLVGGREGARRLRGERLVGQLVAARLRDSPALLRRAVWTRRHGLVDAVSDLEGGPEALAGVLQALPASQLLRVVDGLGPSSDLPRFGARWLAELPLPTGLAARLLALVEVSGAGAGARSQIERWWAARTTDLSVEPEAHERTLRRWQHACLPPVVALVSRGGRVSAASLEEAVDRVCAELGVPPQGPWMAYQKWRLTGGPEAPIARTELVGFLTTWTWGPPTSPTDGGWSWGPWRDRLLPAPHWLDRAASDPALAVALLRGLTARWKDRREAAVVLPDFARAHPEAVAACLVALSEEALDIVLRDGGSEDTWALAGARLAPLATLELVVRRHQREAHRSSALAWAQAARDGGLHADVPRPTVPVEGLPELLAALGPGERVELLRRPTGEVGALAVETVLAGVEAGALAALTAEVLEGRVRWTRDDGPDGRLLVDHHRDAFIDAVLCRLSPDVAVEAGLAPALIQCVAADRRLRATASARRGRRLLWCLADTMPDQSLALRLLRAPPYGAVLWGVLGDDHNDRPGRADVLDTAVGRAWRDDRDDVMKLVEHAVPGDAAEWWTFACAALAHRLPPAVFWSLLRVPELPGWDLWVRESFLSAGPEGRAAVLGDVLERVRSAEPHAFAAWLVEHADFVVTALGRSHLLGWWRAAGLGRGTLTALLEATTAEVVGPGPVAALLKVTPTAIDGLLADPRTRTSTLSEMFATPEGAATACALLQGAGQVPGEDIVTALLKAEHGGGLAGLDAVSAGWALEEQAQLWRMVAARHRGLRGAVWARLARVEAAGAGAV